MSTTTRRVLISCIALLLIGCACTLALGVGGAGVALYSRSLPATATATPLPITPAALTTPTAAPSQTAATQAATAQTGIAQTSTAQPAMGTPAPTQALPAGVAREMNQIQQDDTAIRGLKLYQPVSRALLTSQQLRQHVLDNFLKDYTADDAKKDTLVLSAFGFIPADFDLIDFYKNLYSEQVAGYYDDETKTMYVVSDQSFDGPARMTYAHEFEHALQDQTFDLRNGLHYSEEACKDQSERCAAVQALVEGDASLVEQDWLLAYSTNQDRAQIQQFYQNYSSPVYDSAPEFFKKDFLFPYQQGQEFVQSLYDQGGWNAVNAAFLNPPVSTAQILHPDRYPKDKPVNVTLPDLAGTLGSGWSKVDSGILGEWYTDLMLSSGDDTKARLPDNTAANASDGWNGDAYAIYSNASSGATVLVLSTTWQDQKGAADFSSAFAQYGDARWGKPVDSTSGHLRWKTGGAYVAFDRSGLSTLWVSAPDQSTAQSVLQALHAP